MMKIDRRKKLIQLIHVGKHALAIDEYTYRLLLERITGKTSCTKMNMQELEHVLLELQAKGFAVKSNVLEIKTKTYIQRQTASPQLAAVSQIAYKMRAVWDQMYSENITQDGSEAALNRFICDCVNKTEGRQWGILYIHYKHLPDHLASQALEQLKQWRKRVLNKRAREVKKAQEQGAKNDR